MSEQMRKCEHCQERFHLFRQKKQCHLCGQLFCSKCVPKTTRSTLNNCRVCSICLLIINEHTTRDQLATIHIKHLQAYLLHSKIVTRTRLNSFLVKQDLINLIELKKRRLPIDTYVSVQRDNHRDTINQQTTSIDNSPSISSDEPIEETPVRIEYHRMTLNDISSFESIHDLTVRQLKDILIQNFVSIKGCVEKTDLITKVQLLYRNQQHKQSQPTICNEQSSENLCKVCLDANIDCVFLDCGHLCTCVQCGKRLSECPICRSYIVRVVRVFKS